MKLCKTCQWYRRSDMSKEYDKCAAPIFRRTPHEDFIRGEVNELPPPFCMEMRIDINKCGIDAIHHLPIKESPKC